MLRQWYAQAGGQYDDVALLREAGNRVRASFGSAPEQRGRQSYQDGNLVIRRSVDEIEGRKRTSPARMSSVIDRRRAAPTERIEKEQPQISMRFQMVHYRDTRSVTPWRISPTPPSLPKPPPGFAYRRRIQSMPTFNFVI